MHLKKLSTTVLKRLLSKKEYQAKSVSLLTLPHGALIEIDLRLWYQLAFIRGAREILITSCIVNVADPLCYLWYRSRREAPVLALLLWYPSIHLLPDFVNFCAVTQNKKRTCDVENRNVPKQDLLCCQDQPTPRTSTAMSEQRCHVDTIHNISK